MVKIKEDFYDLILAQVAELKTVKPELKEILDFYEPTLKAHRQVKLSFQPELSEFDIELCHKRNSKGLPFLRLKDIQIDQDLFNGLFEDIVQIIRSKRKEAMPVTINDFPLDKKCALLLRGLMKNNSVLEKLAYKMSIDFSIFYFLITQAFSPFLESYSQKLSEFVDSSSWHRGACPICGSEPLIARLEKETGKKWLFCSLCHCEWLFKRLACAFCGNEDQDSLRYFYVESDETYRVDICDKCKRYIKIVDARKTEQVMNLFVENLATLALDIVANKEGFWGGNISLFRIKEI